MASTLRVDKIDPQSGTALEIGTSGDTVTVPSGVGLTLTDSTLLLPTTINTDKIDPKSGTGLELGTSGDTISLPSGATLDISASTLTPPATMPASSGVNFTALNATNLGSGTVPTARLGTGSASSSTILYGDNTWAAAAGGGGKLLQVVNTSQASSSGSTARTVIDQAITLDSDSNSCLVSVTFTVLRNSGATTAYGGFYITGGGLGATTSGLVFAGAPLYTLGAGVRVGWAATKLDTSPGSTTPTYGFYFAGGADFNMSHSQITVWEIAA